MAIDLPKNKTANDRFAVMQARHNGHVENNSYNEFVNDRKAWEKFVKKNGIAFMPEIDESEPATSKADQSNLDEQAAKIAANIEKAGRPTYPHLESDLQELEQRQQAAARATAAVQKADKPKVTKPSAIRQIAKSVKGGPALRTPKGRVGAAIALFAVLLILVVMVGGVLVSNGNGGTVSTTRWKLAGAVLAQKAVIA